MISKGNFIKATEEYNTFEKVVPAYYFRRSFVSEGKFSAKISVAVCGFYKLYINGRDITKGYLSPYISNTNDYIYYDEYDIKLECGENVIGLILGNGFQNNPGGHRWDFDKADFRSAPMLSLSVTKKEHCPELFRRRAGAFIGVTDPHGILCLHIFPTSFIYTEEKRA